MLPSAAAIIRSAAAGSSFLNSANCDDLIASAETTRGWPAAITPRKIAGSQVSMMQRG
jgi:hypothetical protein